MAAPELEAAGYAEPRGHVYFCLDVEPIDVPPWMDERAVAAAARRAWEGRGSTAGTPVVVAWEELAAQLKSIR